MILTTQEAIAKLSLTHTRWPAGSYLKWVEKEWEDRYKAALVFKHGAWIPSFNKLELLAAVNEAHKIWDEKNRKIEYAKKKELEQLIIKEN